jgi:hypothetical protein
MTFASLVPSPAFAMSTLMSASASASVLATPKPTVRASGSTTRCGAEMPPARGLLPVQHDLTTPRARARAARLRANEAAERREDLAALVTTPVSHPSLFFHLSDVDGCNTTRIVSHWSPVLFLFTGAQCCMTDVGPLPFQAQWALLRRSFAGVKTEFADLDGMSWHVLMPLPVSAPALAGPRPGRRPSLRGSTSASSPVLVLDDTTVRPTFKRKQLTRSGPSSVAMPLRFG